MNVCKIQLKINYVNFSSAFFRPQGVLYVGLSRVLHEIKLNKDIELY